MQDNRLSFFLVLVCACANARVCTTFGKIGLVTNTNFIDRSILVNENWFLEIVIRRATPYLSMAPVCDILVPVPPFSPYAAAAPRDVLTHRSCSL